MSQGILVRFAARRMLSVAGLGTCLETGVGTEPCYPANAIRQTYPSSVIRQTFIRQALSLKPALPNAGQKFFSIGAHLPYQRLIAGVFVGGGPEHHLGKNWRQIDAFPGE